MRCKSCGQLLPPALPTAVPTALPAAAQAPLAVMQPGGIPQIGPPTSPTRGPTNALLLLVVVCLLVVGVVLGGMLQQSIIQNPRPGSSPAPPAAPAPAGFRFSVESVWLMPRDSPAAPPGMVYLALQPYVINDDSVPHYFPHLEIPGAQPALAFETDLPDRVPPHGAAMKTRGFLLPEAQSYRLHVIEPPSAAVVHPLNLWVDLGPLVPPPNYTGGWPPKNLKDPDWAHPGARRGEPTGLTR